MRKREEPRGVLPDPRKKSFRSARRGSRRSYTGSKRVNYEGPVLPLLLEKRGESSRREWKRVTEVYFLQAGVR